MQYHAALGEMIKEHVERERESTKVHLNRDHTFVVHWLAGPPSVYPL